MKKLKRWLALILAVTLVASNAIYSMGSALQADELESASDGAAQVSQADNTQSEPVNEAEGVDVAVVEPPIATPQTEPAAPEVVPEEPAAVQPEESAAVPEQPEAAFFNVTIKAPEMADAGTVKVQKPEGLQQIDATTDYVEKEIKQGSSFVFLLTPQEGYHIDTVKVNGTAIEAKEVTAEGATYELNDINEAKEIVVAWIWDTQQEEAVEPTQSKEPVNKAEPDSMAEPLRYDNPIEIIGGDGSQIGVSETIRLTCNNASKDHRHAWSFNSTYFTSTGGSNEEAIALRARQATIGEPTYVTCGYAAGVGITIVNKNTVVQNAYFYILKPGANKEIYENKSWYNAGIGRIEAPSLKTQSKGTKYYDFAGMIKQTPSSYPDILGTDGETYSYSESGKVGTYSIDWDKIIVADGANAGINNGPTSKEKTYHIDATAILHNKKDCTVTFKVKDPGAAGFSNAQLPYIVKTGTSESELKQPEMPKTKTDDGIVYTFAGWYRNEACTDKVDFKSVVEENATYYGRYVATQYKVTYYTSPKQNEVFFADSNRYSTGDSVAIIKNNPDKNDNVKMFIGWIRDKELIINEEGVIANEEQYNAVKPHLLNYPQQFPMGNQDASLYAVYAKKEVVPFTTINYEVAASGGGTVTSPGETIENPYFGPAAGSTAKAEKGWEFVNWTNRGGTEVEVSKKETFVPEKSRQTGQYENAAYTAYFAVKNYSIKYNLGEGTVQENNPANYNVTSPNIKLNNPTKSGYQFIGWSGTGLAGNDNKAVTIPAGSEGDRTYTANWSANKHNVIYKYYKKDPNNPNDQGSYTSFKQENDISYNSEYTLIDDSVKEGYTFSGWETTDVEVENSKFMMPDKDVIVIGQFEVDVEKKFTYKVKHVFPTNEAFNEETSQELVAEAPITAQPKNVLGYKLSDKKVEPLEAGEQGIFDAAGNFNGTMTGSDVTLTYTYAVDENTKFSYDISYNVPGHPELSSEEKAVVNAEQDISAEPKVVDGYKVVGVEVTPVRLEGGFAGGTAFSGKMPNENVHITYTYGPDSEKTFAYNVKYVVPGNDTLSSATPEQQKSAEQDIVASANAIDGYIVDKVEVTPAGLGSFDEENNFTGKMPNNAVTVTYTYKPDAETKYAYNVEYKVPGNPLLNSSEQIQNLNAESEIKATPIAIPGYIISKTEVTPTDVSGSFDNDNNFTGQMPNRAVTVTYTYEVNRQKTFDFKVEHVVPGKAGLSSSETVEKNAEDSINAVPKQIAGYVVDKTEITPTKVGVFAEDYTLDAKMPNGAVTVVYTYKVDESAYFNYNVNHVFPTKPEWNSSEDTQKLNAEAEIMAVPKVTAGYKVKSVSIEPESAGNIDVSTNMFKGAMPNQAVTLTYSYEVDENIAFNYDVTYEVPGNAGLSSAEETKKLSAEKDIIAAPKTIAGYKVSAAEVAPEGLGSLTEGNAFSAKMPNQDVHITYTYTPDTEKTFGFHVEYVVPGNDELSSSETVQEVVAEGELAAKPKVIEGYVLDKAEVTPAQSGTFDGDNNFSGKMPNQEATVTYTYKVDKEAVYAYNVEYEVPGNPALSSSEETQTQNAESNIKAVPREILGYVVGKTEVTPSKAGSFAEDNNFSGTMPNQAVTVTYTYEVDQQKEFAYNVEYKVPGNPALNDSEETQHFNAEEVIAAQAKVISGYRVSNVSVTPDSAGAFETDNRFSGTMPNQAATVTYTYEADENTTFNYDVSYDVPGNPELSSAEGTAQVSAEKDITAQPRAIDGYKVSKVEATPEGIGSFGEGNVFSAKMPNRDVQVTYTYIPDAERTFAYQVKHIVLENGDLNFEESVQQISAEEEISAQPRTIAGYKVGKTDVNPDKTGTFDGNSYFNGVMPNKAVEVVYTYVTDNSQNYKYIVNYYQDDEMMDSIQEDVFIAAPVVKSVSYDNMPEDYILDEEKSTKLPYTAGEDENIIDVYYTKDAIGEGENPDEGDGIPDIYQVVVDYRAVNGNVDFEKSVVTLEDSDGKPSASGTGILERVAEANAADGYDQNSLTWTPSAPEKGMEITEPATFTASFEAVETEPGTNPVTPATPGNPATPGTPAPAATPTPAAATPAATPTPVTIIETITQPLTALADTIGEALNANVQEIVPVDEDGVPLANKVSTDHKCCVLHILFLLLAMLIEVTYTRSAKKRQKRIFDLREEIALADKELKQKKDHDKEGIA